MWDLERQPIQVTIVDGASAGGCLSFLFFSPLFFSFFRLFRPPFLSPSLSPSFLVQQVLNSSGSLCFVVSLWLLGPPSLPTPK